ncbi:MAG: DNA primase [Firmicutes bacterium]|nr:DNA primase [Bacillota bacterium]
MPNVTDLRRRLRRRHRQEKGVLIKLKKEKGPAGLSFFVFNYPSRCRGRNSKCCVPTGLFFFYGTSSVTAKNFCEKRGFEEVFWYSILSDLFCTAVRRGKGGLFVHFSDQFLDEVVARNDIADVVSSYVTLTRKGGNLFGLCPFHNEKTPSFSVAPDKQIYHCFGCKKGGGVINFIMEIEGLSFPEAVEFLAKRANIPLPAEDESRSNADRLRRRVLELNRAAARWYYDQLQLPQGAAVQAYLDKRQIRRGIAVRFGMGASLDQWDALLRAMTDKGFTKQELLASGLVVNGKNGGLYDKFRNRLMLPVIDVRGDVVGFGSRVIDKSEPKYMNTTETVAYSKRRVLYGLNLAKKTKRPNMILCEGNLDVVTLHQAGFDNAVACMGTALTQEQIRLLSRFTKELVLCYDNDGAGQMATDRALELLQNSEFTVKVLRLPQRLVDGHYVKQDADDFIKYQGRDAFEQLLSGSANGIEFTMSEIAAKYDLKDDKGRIAYAGEIAETLCKLNDPVGREVYTTRAAEAASLPVEAMRMEVQRAAKRVQAKARKAQERQEMNPISALQPADRSIRYQNVRSALAEEGVIRLLMQDESLFPPEMPVRPEEFSSPLLGRIYGELWQRRGHASMAALAAVLTPEEMNHLTALLQKPESAANAPQALADYIRIIREEHTKRTGGTDPLAAAMETYKDKKGYGGKRT